MSYETMQAWAKEVSKKLIDQGMTRRELALKLGIPYTALCAVISGSRVIPKTQKKICSYFNVNTEEVKIDKASRSK